MKYGVLIFPTDPSIRPDDLARELSPLPDDALVPVGWVREYLGDLRGTVADDDSELISRTVDYWLAIALEQDRKCRARQRGADR